MSDPARLEAAAQAAIASATNQVLISAATAWEIAIKRALGRLTFPVDRFDDVLQRMGFDSLPILPTHAIAAGSLPRHHDDPFDRILIAQALAEGLTLVSTDQLVRRYDVAVFAAA